MACGIVAARFAVGVRAQDGGGRSWRLLEAPRARGDPVGGRAAGEGGPAGGYVRERVGGWAQRGGGGELPGGCEGKGGGGNPGVKSFLVVPCLGLRPPVPQFLSV